MFSRVFRLLLSLDYVKLGEINRFISQTFKTIKFLFKNSNFILVKIIFGLFSHLLETFFQFASLNTGFVDSKEA